MPAAMIKRAIIVKQVPHEGPGAILDVLRQFRVHAYEVNAYEGQPVPISVDSETAVIVMGGPMGANDENIYPFLRDELRLIEFALKNNVPLLGICLGAQLMARAGGARVYKGKKKEIGWYDLELTREGLRDPLLLGLPEVMKVFQWHGDTFDCPKGAVNLAKSKLFENQFLKIGKRAYALQFHLEVTEAMIHEWLEDGGNAAELKKLKAYIDPKKVVKETPTNMPLLKTYGKAVFSRFFRI